MDKETTLVNVTGMTCEHCTAAVTEELMQIENVHAVRIDLVRDGVSPVEVDSHGPLDTDAVAEAVAEAGYTVSV